MVRVARSLVGSARARDADSRTRTCPGSRRGAARGRPHRSHLDPTVRALADTAPQPGRNAELAGWTPMGTASPCRPPIGRSRMLLRVRVTLPDRPGALGQVARTLGVAGADIVQVVVLERLGGRAVDDFTVVWPGASRVERLLAGLATDRKSVV